MIVETLAMIGDTPPGVYGEQEASRLAVVDRSAVGAAVQRSEDVCVEAVFRRGDRGGVNPRYSNPAAPPI